MGYSGNTYIFKDKKELKKFKKKYLELEDKDSICYFTSNFSNLMLHFD